MNVLRILSNLGVGGVQKQTLIQAQHLPERVKLDICAFYRGGVLEKTFKDTPTIGNVFIFGASNKYSPVALVKLIKLYQKYNLIHIHKMEDIIPICSLAAIISNKPFIIHLHFVYSWPNKRKLIMEKICYHRASRVIAVSQEVRKHSSNKLSIPIEKIRCVYNGVSTKYTEKTSKNKNYLILGMISRLEKFKNIDFSIQIFKNILKFRKGILLIITGKGKEEKKLRNLSSGISSIKFLGEKINTEEILTKIDVGLLLSKKEGFSNTLLDYMNYAKAVLISDIPQNREAIPDKHTGFILQDNNHAILIKSLLENPKERKIRALRAHIRVRNNFDVRRTVYRLYR